MKQRSEDSYFKDIIDMVLNKKAYELLRRLPIKAGAAYRSRRVLIGCQNSTTPPSVPFL